MDTGKKTGNQAGIRQIILHTHTHTHTHAQNEKPVVFYSELLKKPVMVRQGSQLLNFYGFSYFMN